MNATLRTCEGCSCVIDITMYKIVNPKNPDKIKKGEKHKDDDEWWTCKNCGFHNEP